MGKTDERDNSKPAFQESAEVGAPKSVALKFAEVI